ncbi:glutamate-cysteine ligase family protein [Cryptobacterium curtum]
MTAENNHIQAENRRRIVEYLQAGCQPVAAKARHADGTLDAPGALGVEVEHFVVTDPDKRPVFYEPRDGKLGVRDVLEYLAQWYPVVDRNSAGEVLALRSDEASITIEPAAQLEISIAPLARVDQVKSAYEHFRRVLDPFLHEHACQLLGLGYHPTTQALDMELIPKQRYRFMDEHFHHIGTHGERMMRASASTQVSVDFTSEVDAVEKFRVALALGPILAYICDNAPVFEGKPNTIPLARLNLWRDVDNARCGIIPGAFDDGWDFGSYADYLLGASPIFVTQPEVRAVGETLARDAYGDRLMDQSDIEHLISMFWPDVRLKQFVEIRPADSMPADCIYGYAALIKGIFYAQESLQTIEEVLGVHEGIWPLHDDSVDSALRAIRAEGRQACVYGHLVTTWIDLLFEVAEQVLDTEERPCLAPLKRFAQEH